MDASLRRSATSASGSSRQLRGLSAPTEDQLTPLLPRPRRQRTAGSPRRFSAAASRRLQEDRMARAAAALQRCSRMLRRRIGHQAEDRQFDQQMRMKDGHIALFSMIGLSVMVLLDVAAWYSSGDVTKVGYQTSSGAVKSVLMSLQLVLTMSTFACLALLIQYYNLMLTKKRREWCSVEPRAAYSQETDLERRERLRQEDALSASYSLWASPVLRSEFLCEVGVHAFHPIILLQEPAPGLYSFLQVWMFLRLYVIARLLHTHSDLHKNRFEITTNNVELQRTGTRIKMPMTLKIIFTENTAIAAAVFALLTVFLGAFGFFLVERSSQLTDPWVADPSNWAADFNLALWVAFATATTIGYGDYWPSTAEGRLVAVLVGLFGICVTVAFQALVTNNISLSKVDKQVKEYLVLRSEMVLEKHAAATLIQRMWREKKARCSMWRLPVLDRGNLLYDAIIELRRHRLLVQEAIVSSNDVVLEHQVDNLRQEARLVAERVQELQDAVQDLNIGTLRGIKVLRRALRHREPRPAPPQQQQQAAVERGGGGDGPAPVAQVRSAAPGAPPERGDAQLPR